MLVPLLFIVLGVGGLLIGIYAALGSWGEVCRFFGTERGRLTRDQILVYIALNVAAWALG